MEVGPYGPDELATGHTHSLWLAIRKLELKIVSPLSIHDLSIIDDHTHMNRPKVHKQQIVSQSIG